MNTNIGFFSAYLFSQKGNVYGHSHSARKGKGSIPVPAAWPDKNELHQIQAEIERFLDEKLHLELNKKTCIRPAWLPVTFVGAQITPKAIRMRKSTRKRMFRRMKYIRGLFEIGRIAFEKVNNTMQSYFGLIGTFTARNLLRKVIDEFSFRIIKHDNSTG